MWYNIEYNQSHINTIEALFGTHPDGWDTAWNNIVYNRTHINSLESNKQDKLYYTPPRQGGGYRQSSNCLFIGWTGSRLALTVDNTDIGDFAMTSDIDSLKKSVSDGKSSIASAVTAKGVATSSDATFATIVNNINAIKISNYSTISCIGKQTASAGPVSSTSSVTASVYFTLSAGSYIIVASHTMVNHGSYITPSIGNADSSELIGSEDSIRITKIMLNSTKTISVNTWVSPGEAACAYGRVAALVLTT